MEFLLCGTSFALPPIMTMAATSKKIHWATDESANFAKQQGLRYVLDSEPGYSRKRRGKYFDFYDSKNKKVTDKKLIERFKSLVIPPAWQDVWICRYPAGHLQVTGRDARGRKQYRYHANWTTSRNENKFEKLFHFGTALEKIRARVSQDLRKHGLPKEKVLAAVVQVLEQTRIRVGNDIYSRENNSYGLTTIRNKHAEIKGSKVRFRFQGKSKVHRDVTLSDPRLSKIIRNCQDMPGEELFCYEDEDGKIHDIGSSDVNQYIQEISGGAPVTAKDFRTWGGTIKAIEILLDKGKLDTETQRARKAREVEVIKQVASYLGNTVAVCRKYYVSPLVFEADSIGNLHEMAQKNKKIRAHKAYAPCEMLLLKLLKK